MSPVAPTDEALMTAHLAGDGDAFDVLVRRHSAGLWNVAVGILRHPADADDAVQEGLLGALRRAGTYRGDASVHSWLYRIVVNACIDRIRVDSRRATVPLLDRDFPARRADHATELVVRLDIGDALAALPMEQRLAVVLVDMEGWSLAETAAMMEVPIGTVKSRCARGRLRLASLLGHMREEDRRP